jgi:hypothetical protein
MRRVVLYLSIASIAGLGACTVAPPNAPTVMALPAQGKSFETFQQDDYVCRDYAYTQSGGDASSRAAGDSAVGSALLGTALGAGVGAALGSIGGNAGAGAAIGGATGLLAGGSIGAGNARSIGGNAQQQYDSSYTQCMYSRGNSVQSAPTSYAAYPSPYYYGPGYYGPGYYGPSVVVGGGWGHRGWRRW